MTRGRYLLFSLCAMLAASLISVAMAQDSIMALPIDQSAASTVSLVAASKTEPLPPYLTQLEAQQLLLHRFPHLQNDEQPDVALTQRSTPSGLLQIYTFTWKEHKLSVEQNADTGEVIQYADLGALAGSQKSEAPGAISQSAAKMLAKARMQRVLSQEEATYYPGDPEFALSDSGIYMFFWARHYHKIPYYQEQLMIAIDPATGMTVAMLDQRDYSLIEPPTKPATYLSRDEALALTRKHIDPVLINVQLAPDQDPAQVWFSGITFPAFDASGKDFETMTKEKSISLKEGQVLLVDKATATKRFSASLDLSLQWVSPSDTDKSTNSNAPLALVYKITFHPLKESPASMIPATIGEAEFVSALQILSR